MSKYAIFLPVRNGAAYIREAIDSVVAQTMGDWVLVVLDNASSDGTVELVDKYRHPNIQLHLSTTDLSIWESWHRVCGLLESGEVDSEFTTILGHDDRLLPAFLETIDQLIAANPSASLYQTGFDMIDARGRLIRPCRPIPSLETSTDFLAARLWGLRDSFGVGYVFRSADYIALGGIPDLPQLLHSDDILFARLGRIHSKVASSVRQCAYRLHRASASNSLSVKRISSQVAAIDIYINFLREEFGEFVSSQAGAAAIACFLAREVMVLGPVATGQLLPQVTCRTIQSLTSIYRSVAGSIDYRQWLGTNWVSRDVYVRSKQLMLLSVLIRNRLFYSS